MVIKLKTDPSNGLKRCEFCFVKSQQITHDFAKHPHLPSERCAVAHILRDLRHEVGSMTGRALVYHHPFGFLLRELPSVMEKRMETTIVYWYPQNGIRQSSETVLWDYTV